MRFLGSLCISLGLLATTGVTAEPTKTKAARAIEPGSYDAALIAAVCHWVQEGSHDDALANLRAVLDKHPELINARRAFRQPRKPARTDSYTPLHYAAEGGPEVAALLLEKGAEVNADDGRGWTPLHLAALNGNLTVVKLLVEHGANIHAKTAPIPETSSDQIPSGPAPIPGEPRKSPKIYPAVPARSPLDCARENKHDDVVKYLRSIEK